MEISHSIQGNKFLVHLYVLVVFFLIDYAWANSLSSSTFDLKMPGVIPNHHDKYYCTPFPVNEESYVTAMTPHAKMEEAHHMIIFGCDYPAYTRRKEWDCEHVNDICQGSARIIYAWARNAPPTILPDDVGFRIGGSSGINFLILQVHYAHPFTDGHRDYSGITLTTTRLPPRYLAGIWILAADSRYQQIPANRKKAFIDVSCQLNAPVPIHPFAFRTHAHVLGKVISGYKVENNRWTLLGKGNPQWPQAFYPMDKIHTVNPGDVLAARCTYDSSKRDRVTKIGSTAADEMCNFYIMYYTDAQRGVPFGECSYNMPNVNKNMPADASVPLPPNPELDALEGGEEQVHPATAASPPVSQSFMDAFGKLSKNPYRGGPARGIPAYDDSLYQDYGYFDNRGSKYEKLPKLQHLADWLPDKQDFGNIGGIAADNQQHLHVFHRGSHVWNSRTFNNKNQLREEARTPITVDTVVTLDAVTGQVVSQWGKDLFYLPHGITTDTQGNFWLTDAGAHQVYKFPPGGSTKPSLVLGMKFEPGSDSSHFCKPADIVVASNGEFYVADGYCNNRVMKFSAKGELMKQWNVDSIHPDPIVHSITLAEDKGLVCVSVRLEARIDCYDMKSGALVSKYQSPQFQPQLFAVDYSPNFGGVLYAVNADLPSSPDAIYKGFTINITDGVILSSWGPAGFKMFRTPHDLTVSPDGTSVFVAELLSSDIYKFQIPSSGHQQEKKDNIIGNGQGLVRPIGDQKSAHAETVEKDKDENKKKAVKSDGDMSASMIIMALLAVPVVLMIIITIVVRLKRQGKLNHLKGWMNGYTPTDKLNLGNLLNRHHGFDRVSTEDSDHEIDPLNDSDSEIEEYTSTTKA